MNYLVLAAIVVLKPLGPTDMVVESPTICMVSNTFEEYKTCRAPEIYRELHDAAKNAYCDFIAHANEQGCDLNWRAGIEWRAVQRSKGVTPK